MKRSIVNKCHIFHIFASCSNLLLIRLIFLNQVILGYDHDSSAVSTICAKHDLINTCMISMISYTFARSYISFLKTIVVYNMFSCSVDFQITFIQQEGIKSLNISFQGTIFIWDMYTSVSNGYNDGVF